jgi:Skp family chaperone for outer membrane proteins
MKTKERGFIYAALAALVILNLAVLHGGIPRSAVALPLQSDAPAIGPASTVTLAGSDDSDLVLRNQDGHLTWGAAPYQQAHSFGFVHIGPLMGELMAAEKYQEEREALVEDLTKVDEDYRAQLGEIQARIETMDPESPDAQEARARGQRLFQEAQQWGLEAQRRQAALQAQQMIVAYEELVAAVNVTAERLQIDVVLRYIPAEEPFESASPDQVLTSIRLRTALRRPQDIDITPEVAKELSLEIE